MTRRFRAFCLFISTLTTGASFAQQHKTASLAPAACGPLSGQLLKCPRFGFTYSVPFGWVDRTSDLGQNGDTDSGPSTAAQSEKAESETLLAVFQRPPGAPGDTIDSAAVIAAENIKNYQGIKTAADYLGPVAELAKQRGFEIVNEPYEFGVGSKQLVRADFRKNRGKLEMWQSTLVTIEKGEIVSFTFIGGSEDEITDLIGQLRFAARTPPRK